MSLSGAVASSRVKFQWNYWQSGIQKGSWGGVSTTRTLGSPTHSECFSKDSNLVQTSCYFIHCWCVLVSTLSWPEICLKWLKYVRCKSLLDTRWEYRNTDHFPHLRYSLGWKGPVEPLVSSPLWSRAGFKVGQVAQCLVKFWDSSRRKFPLPLWAASAGASPPLRRQGLERHRWNILVGSKREVMEQEQAETWGVNLCRLVFCSPMDWLHSLDQFNFLAQVLWNPHVMDIIKIKLHRNSWCHF